MCANHVRTQVGSSGETGVFTANLNDVPFPPGAVVDSTNYRTGMASLDTSRTDMLFYPLNPTDYGSASISNNLGVFDVTTGTGPYSYLIDTSTSTSYGMPSDGGVGMGVNGQSIFPIYNNNAGYTPAKCEVDSCNEHVGQGGGQPHFHGDMFGAKCLYSQTNYSGGSASSHPPIVGFAADGVPIIPRPHPRPCPCASLPPRRAPVLTDGLPCMPSLARVDSRGRRPPDLWPLPILECSGLRCATPGRLWGAQAHKHHRCGRARQQPGHLPLSHPGLRRYVPIGGAVYGRRSLHGVHHRTLPVLHRKCGPERRVLCTDGDD